MVSVNGKGGPKRMVTGRELFDHGTVVGDHDSARVCEKHKLSPLVLTAMHVSGIWGDVSPEHAAANEAGLKTGGPIMSVYTFGRDKIIIVTNAERTGTLIMGELSE
ncbi:MAG: hypothetical protein AMXMBFR58_29400 [Phycisphaerae bacterium]